MLLRASLCCGENIPCPGHKWSSSVRRRRSPRVTQAHMEASPCLAVLQRRYSLPWLNANQTYSSICAHMDKSLGTSGSNPCSKKSRCLLQGCRLGFGHFQAE